MAHTLRNGRYYFRSIVTQKTGISTKKSGLQHFLDGDLQRIAQGGEIVPSLEDEDHGGFGAGKDAPDDAVDPLVGDADVRVRIVGVDVVARGDENDVRSEPLDQAWQDVLVHRKVVL